VARTGMAADSWRRDPRVGWFAFALGALGVFVLVALFATAWPAFDRLDGHLSAAIRSTRTPTLTQISGWLTLLASEPVVLPITAAMVVWMAIRRNWAAAIYVVMTVPVGWFLGNDIIKNIIRRPRPSGVSIAPITTDFSMPSGHALGAFLLFATLCVIVMLNVPTGRHMKRWLVAVSAVAIIAMGLSRVYIGVHWFGDVLGAWLLGGAWWSFTTATYFGSVTEQRRVALRSAGSASPPES
jgi:membrane-associated phospholipid phosphatase